MKPERTPRDLLRVWVRRLPGTLILLVSVTCAATEAAAQGSGSDVTLYGRLNASVEFVTRNQPGRSPESNFRVSSNSSNFGVRGTEALGAGWSAVFQVESQVDNDVGSGVLAGRETFVGLKSHWGTLKMGNFLAPYDDLHAIFGNAPTLTTSILSTAALWAQGVASKSTGGFDVRLPNSVRWDSPVWGGINLETQYSTLERAGNANVVSIGAFYTGATFLAGAVFERNHDVRGDGLGDSAFSIAGSYSFTPADVAAVYERLHYETPLGSLDRNFWGLSLTASAGPGVLYAFYGRASDGSGSAPDRTRIAGLAKGPGTASTQWELSYTYSASKRTLFYAGYVKLDNGPQASYTFAINPYPVAIGGKPAGWVLGMAHFF